MKVKQLKAFLDTCADDLEVVYLSTEDMGNVDKDYYCVLEYAKLEKVRVFKSYDWMADRISDADNGIESVVIY
jgi:hypothetical protein